GSDNDQETFFAFPSILSRRSRFSKAALKVWWAEGNNGEIVLSEDRPKTVAIICSSTRFPGILEARDLHNTYVELSHLYVFAEKVQDITTKNTVLEAFFELLHVLHAQYVMGYDIITMPSPQAIRIIYAGTPTGCSARRLLVDMYVASADSDFLEEGYWPPEFMLDLARTLMDVCAAGSYTTAPLTVEKYTENPDEDV
ncbi:hypothetical protein BU23DRAFT_453650, partial [Bimuria novae-zelandiae CBS 107.79]